MTNQPCHPEASAAYDDQAPLIAYNISDRVMLAGQPQPTDWAALYDQGYRLVINMRSDPERAAVQARYAEAVGLRYLHLPLPAYELEPEHLAEFHAALQAAAPDEKIVVHCRTASRVALLWMLDQITYTGLSTADAEAALRAAGYDDDAMETFSFCADDYFDRTAQPQAATAASR